MSLRVFFIGGWMSYRALFGWLSPWILIPIFIIDPIFQIIFFAYVGRAADYGSDEFFLIGNAIIAAATPCLFATGSTIGGERDFKTLGLLLGNPLDHLSVRARRSKPHSLGARVRQPCLHPVPDHGALELREDAHHLE